MVWGEDRMVRFFVALSLLVPAFALAVETSSEDLRAQIQRLEAALKQNALSQKTSAETFQALEKEKEERFTKKKEEVAEALVTLPVKAFPSPTSARERRGESQIQASLVRYAGQQFELLSKVADSDANEVLPALDAKAAAPDLTSFATLKQRLNQVGDQVLSREGALGSVADMIKARVEAIRAQEKPRTASDTDSSEDHPGTPDEALVKKAESTLNQQIAAEFERSAKLADGYFKLAEEKLQPLADGETKAEQDKAIARNETPPETQPPASLGQEPQAPEPPPQAPPNSQNQNQASQQKPMNQNAQNTRPRSAAGGGQQAGADSKSDHPSLAPAKIASPGSIPEVGRLTMESPGETDLSAVADATRRIANAASLTEAFPVAPLPISQNPFSNPASLPPAAVAAEPARSVASLQGNRTPGSSVANREGTMTESEPTQPSTGNAAFAKTNANASGGEAGVFNVDPKYRANDERRPQRVSVGFSNGGEEDDEEGSPQSVSSLVYNGSSGLPLLTGGPPRVQRGILSHVGEWCRTLGRVSVCAK